MISKKHKINKVDLYVIFSISMLIIYTVTMIYALVHGIMVNDVLTTCFFAAFGGELLFACVIKSLNIKNEKYNINPEQTDPEPIESKEEGVG